jgi:predicted dehydrogenase
LSGHPSVTIAAVADLDAARAASVAATLPSAEVMPVEAFRDAGVETVLNLTIPAAHATVALGAISQGLGVYGEKPLAATLDDAAAIVAAAGATGVTLGCAPDTVLGTGIQTARAAVDGGIIGRPVAASATMVTPGHERWHPNPDFYYLPGGGPLLDMGPYYLTALVQLLGPIRAVTGAASRLRDTRVRLDGEHIPVAVDTHVTGVLEHVNGALSTITTSFDAVRSTAAPIEIHGESGSLAVPDPNRFDGDVRLFALGADDWVVLPPSAGYVGAARGIGLLDQIGAAAPRATGELALHVLEAMVGLLSSAASGERVMLTTTAARPAPVPLTPAERWTAGGW